MTAAFDVPSASDRLLLTAATAPAPAAVAAWERWYPTVVLEDLEPRVSRFLPQVFANLHAAREDERLPPRLRGKYKWVWSNNQLQIGRDAAVITILRAARTDPLLMKGHALLAAGRADLGARELGPLYVAVPPDRLAVASRALEENGWRPNRNAGSSYLTGRLALRVHGWRFFSGDRHVDLNWHVYALRRDAAVADDYWGHARDAPLGAAAALVPDDAGLLLHLIEEQSRLPEAGLQWIVDVAQIAPHVDASELSRRAHRLGIAGTAAAALRTVASATSSAAAAELAERIGAPSWWERAHRWTDRSRLGPFELPRAGETVRQLLAHGAGPRQLPSGVRAVARRRVEPHLWQGRKLGAAIVAARHAPWLEAAARRRFGALARPPAAMTGPTTGPAGSRILLDEWVRADDAAQLDRVGGPGWSWPDISGVWADGAQARMVFDLAAPTGVALTLEVQAGFNVHCSPNPHVDVVVNGENLARWDVREVFAGDPDLIARVAVPVAVADRCRPIEVTFRPTGPFRPRSRGEEAGDRQPFLNVLGVRLRAA